MAKLNASFVVSRSLGGAGVRSRLPRVVDLLLLFAPFLLIGEIIRLRQTHAPLPKNRSVFLSNLRNR